MNRFTFLQAAVVIGGSIVTGGVLTVAILVLPAMDSHFDAAAVSARLSAHGAPSPQGTERMQARVQWRPR